MNLLEEPSLHSGDNLDNLLRAYFQAEMPNPWPSLEAPAPSLRVVPARPAKKTGRTLVRSRLALAASIALLVSGPLFLAGKMRDGEKNGEPLDGPATSMRERPPVAPSHLPSDMHLIQKPDGTYIQIDSLLDPPQK